MSAQQEPDRATGIARAAGVALVQQRNAAGRNQQFPDHASYIRFLQGQNYLRSRPRPSATAVAAPSPGPTPTPAPTVPDAPTGVTATAGNASASVRFTRPTNTGGSDILDYTVTSNPGGFTATGTATTLNITGLSNGQDYTFTVTARNRVGISAPSTASDSVTPIAATPRVPGTAKLGISLYDNANLVNSSGNPYTTIYSNINKISADTAGNIIVGGAYRPGTLTLNRPDVDGVTQIATMTETFDGSGSFVQGQTSYYLNNLFVAKYSASGSPIWSAKISGTTNIGMVMYGVASDSFNNIYALIGASGTSATPNIVTMYNEDGTAFGSKSNVFGYGSTIPARLFIIKYTSTGVVQWVNSITAGDNNNVFVLLSIANLAVDLSDNPYVSMQVQRAGGGTGPTSIKFYKYSSVNAGVIQDTRITSDSYLFNQLPYENQRGFLIKFDSNGNYSWIARMAQPAAYGEQNGGGAVGNIVFDSSNNVFLAFNAVIQASSPISNIYSGVAPTSDPLPVVGTGYYRYDLRGASISPSLPQYYKFASVIRFSSSGAFEGVAGGHGLHNSTVILGMNGAVGIHRSSNSLYLVMNADGFIGTNAGSGAQLNKLYLHSFVNNTANSSNYDVTVATTFEVPLAQPQTLLAIVKYNTNLQAQSVAYIDTPGENSSTKYGSPTVPSVDSSGNVYIVTTIKDSATTKTVKTFNSQSGSTATFNTFGTVSATNTFTDGLVVSYNGDLTTARWATVVGSSDAQNDSGLVCQVTSDNYVFVGGNSTLDKTASSNTIGINSYSTVTMGAVQNTLFGTLDVTEAIDRAGFLIKYE